MSSECLWLWGLAAFPGCRIHFCWKSSWVELMARLLPIVGRKFHMGLLSKGTDILVPNYVLKDGLYSKQPWNGAGFSLWSRGQVCFLSRIIKIISASGVKVEQAYYCPIRSYLNPEFLSHGCVCVLNLSRLLHKFFPWGQSELTEAWSSDWPLCNE